MVAPLAYRYYSLIFLLQTSLSEVERAKGFDVWLHSCAICKIDCVGRAASTPWKILGDLRYLLTLSRVDYLVLPWGDFSYFECLKD